MTMKPITKDQHRSDYVLHFSFSEHIFLYFLSISSLEEQAWHDEQLPEHLPVQPPLKLLHFFLR